MTDFSKYTTILWDFDGVLIDSMDIRDRGFVLALAGYPANEVEALLAWHRANGGLSRYVKFRYFFETIRNEPITEKKIGELASRFSSIVTRELSNPALLIDDAIQFIGENYNRFDMHVVSGSDQEELRMLCKKLHINIFFKSVCGSPTPKTQLIRSLLKRNKYKLSEVVLIGDSVNDMEAANDNSIDFMGYNNPHLRDLEVNYIDRLV